MKRFSWIAIAVFAFMIGTPAAFAFHQYGPGTNDCQCGADNPFPYNNDSSTWSAWESACCHWGNAWGTANVVHGDAKDWLNEARTAGWPTGTTPVEDCIFVKTDAGTYGQVGWVDKVYADGSFDSSETTYWYWHGGYGNHYAAGYATGFIYMKGKAPICSTVIRLSSDTVIDDRNFCFERQGPLQYWGDAPLWL